MEYSRTRENLRGARGGDSFFTTVPLLDSFDFDLSGSVKASDNCGHNKNGPIIADVASATGVGELEVAERKKWFLAHLAKTEEPKPKNSNLS